MWTSISDLKYLHVHSAFEAETLIFAVALIHLNQRIMVRCMRQSPLQVEHLIASCISPEYWGTFSVTVSTPNLDLKKITQMIQGIFFPPCDSPLYGCGSSKKMVTGRRE